VVSVEEMAVVRRHADNAASSELRRKPRPCRQQPTVTRKERSPSRPCLSGSPGDKLELRNVSETSSPKWRLAPRGLPSHQADLAERGATL